jgi:hypothetical protein
MTREQAAALQVLRPQGTPDSSGSGTRHASACRINPAFRWWQQGVSRCLAAGVVWLGAALLGLSAWAKPEFRPGEVWLDTSGNPIQAHGGGMLVHRNVYYWYGENHPTPTPAPAKISQEKK